MRKIPSAARGDFVLLLALGMLASGSSLAGANLARGPFLQRPSDTSIAVLWKTSLPDLGSVAYRPDAPAGQPRRRVLAGGRLSEESRGLRSWTIAVEAGPQETHRVVLPDLAPGIVYEYEIFGDGNALSPAFRFRAPRCPTDNSLSFAVIGDTTGGAVPAAIADRLSQAEVDLVLHVGDVVYPDGRREDYDPSFFAPFAPLLATAPIMPILGDHDVRTSNGAPFFEAFDLPPNGLTPDPRFYSFRQGDAEFFCLDVESSAFGEDSVQYRWLEQGLAASTATWKFVTVFEPPFTSENSNVVEQLVLSPLFERYGVDLVFSGHEHLYERTHPICLTGPPGHGGRLRRGRGRRGVGFEFRPGELLRISRGRPWLCHGSHREWLAASRSARRRRLRHRLDDTRRGAENG